MSPMAPAPKSCQARQNDGWYVLWNGRAGARPATDPSPGRPARAAPRSAAACPAARSGGRSSSGPRHLADGAGLEPLLHQAQALFRAALIAHLRDDLVPSGPPRSRARLADGARHRLLHVDVLAGAASPPSRSQACVWSGVATRTASMSFCFSSITRKSLYSVTFGRRLGVRRAASAPPGSSLSSADRGAHDVVGLGDVAQVVRAHGVAGASADDGHVDRLAGRLEAAPSACAARWSACGGGGHGPHDRRRDDLEGLFFLAVVPISLRTLTTGRVRGALTDVWSPPLSGNRIGSASAEGARTGTDPPPALDVERQEDVVPHPANSRDVAITQGRVGHVHGSADDTMRTRASVGASYASRPVSTRAPSSANPGNGGMLVWRCDHRCRVAANALAMQGGQVAVARHTTHGDLCAWREDSRSDASTTTPRLRPGERSRWRPATRTTRAGPDVVACADATAPIPAAMVTA